MGLDPDKYRLSAAEHKAIYDQDISRKIFGGSTPVPHPVAIIFGGQPGAGKTASVAAAEQELRHKGGLVQIIGDDLRAFHPQYDRLLAVDDKTAAAYTDRDTGRWVEMAIAEATSRKVNLVIEGTMRDADKVAATMQDLRGAGYSIDARALAVSARLSEQGILERYERQKADRGDGRLTTQQAHSAALTGMLVTVERIEREKLADRLTLYRRGNDPIYSNELKGGDWEKAPGARQALEAERDRPMTVPELRSYFQGYDRLAESLRQPGRQASPEEVRNVDERRLRARNELAAAVFLHVTQDKAVQEFPQLARAYDDVQAIEAKAQASGLDARQRSIVVDRAKANIAMSVTRGESVTRESDKHMDSGSDASISNRDIDLGR